MDAFTTREIATILWLTVLGGWAVSVKPIRSSLGSVIAAAFHPKLAIPGALLVAYVSMVIWLLHWIGAWDVDLLKETMIWFALTGLLLPFAFASKTEGRSFFLGFARDSIKAIVVIEFLIATYTFALPIELVLIPFASLIAMLDVLARSKPEHAPVAKVTTTVQALLGFAILAAALFKATGDFQQLGSFSSFRELLLPAVLTVSLAPFAYMLLLYSSYEQLFLRVDVPAVTDRRVASYAKRQMIRHVKLNPHRARAILRSHALDLMRIRTKADVDAIVSIIDRDAA